MSERTPRDLLTSVVRSVTDLWDEPLDEVHDVPQIVNAILASPALDALVAERVAALGEGHAALVGLARGMFPTTDGLRNPEAWARQAAELMCEFLAAALTERRPS